MHRTHVTTTSNELITLKNTFLHSFGSIQCKKILGIFLLFPQYFHLYFIGNQIFPRVMISVNMPFFSLNSLLMQKSNQNQWIYDDFTTSRPSTGSEPQYNFRLLLKFRKTRWIFNVIINVHSIKYHGSGIFFHFIITLFTIM